MTGKTHQCVLMTASLPPRAPTCRKKQDASVCHEEWEQNNERKENPLFCDTDSLFMDSYPMPEVACICPDVMGKVTAWNWDWGGEAGWAGTGRRTMIRLDQLSHTKHEKQPPTLNFRKKKCWAKGAHRALCSNGKSATGTNTAWRHTVQARLWRLDQTLPTHKGMGGPKDRWDGTTSDRNMNGCIYIHAALRSPKNPNVNGLVQRPPPIPRKCKLKPAPRCHNKNGTQPRTCPL